MRGKLILEVRRCEECGRYGPCDTHHIVFKGIGGHDGLDFPLNYKQLGNFLSCDHHEGSKGPHHNRKKDLQYKREMQAKLEIILTNDYYTPEEIEKILEIPNKQIRYVFKTLTRYVEGYKKEDILRRLMGGQLY